MADIGALAGLVLAQNVKLMFGDDTRVISMRQVRVPKTHPESRFNYGLEEIISMEPLILEYHLLYL